MPKDRGALIRTRPAYLREVFHDAHWRVYEVTGAAPLASGAGARVTAMDTDTVDLDVPRPGRVTLRVRFTPYWRIAQGQGCVRSAGNWTALTVRRPGHVRIAAAFALSRVHADGPRCSG